jgi:hypothetical protein
MKHRQNRPCDTPLILGVSSCPNCHELGEPCRRLRLHARHRVRVNIEGDGLIRDHQTDDGELTLRHFKVNLSRTGHNRTDPTPPPPEPDMREGTTW